MCRGREVDVGHDLVGRQLVLGGPVVGHLAPRPGPLCTARGRDQVIDQQRLFLEIPADLGHPAAAEVMELFRPPIPGVRVETALRAGPPVTIDLGDVIMATWVRSGSTIR